MGCFNINIYWDWYNTLAEEASEWLPWLYVVISNFKTFVLETHHGISGAYLQEYLNESYRLKRRFWEPEISNRLSRLAINHQPVFFSA